MRRGPRAAIAAAVVLGCAATTACTGPSSALDTAGRNAETTAQLFWWMTVVGTIIWAAVVGLALFASRGRRVEHGQRFAPLIVVGGGIVFPAVVLTILLGFGLAPLARPAIGGGDGTLRIAVSGEQWWWRVRYTTPSGQHVDLANEIRLPVGERVEVTLSSDNVIHAFWIPALAGKIDMIPGRTTRLILEPTRTGVFRGVCAEYCGTSHALMAFAVEVLEPHEFEGWIAGQAEDAVAPQGTDALHGRELFLAHGCGACHVLRGTTARGRVGPDLTHLASRLSLAAGALPNDAASLTDWLVAPDRVKPEAHMPAFGMLPPHDLRALAAYLDGLQ